MATMEWQDSEQSDDDNVNDSHAPSSRKRSSRGARRHLNGALSRSSFSRPLSLLLPFNSLRSVQKDQEQMRKSSRPLCPMQELCARWNRCVLLKHPPPPLPTPRSTNTQYLFFFFLACTYLGTHPLDGAAIGGFLHATIE